MSGSGLTPKFYESGTLAASGSTRGFYFSSPFSVQVSGTWVGSWVLEASSDAGATWINCTLNDGSQNVFTGNTYLPLPNVFQRGVQYRITFTRTSGTLAWAFAQ